MQNEELILPYAWDQRQVLIQDRIFHAPSRYAAGPSFHFPGWNAPELFGNNLPVQIEYCSGNGAWIADKAASFPKLNWVAVEMKWARVCKIWGQIKRRGLSNLIVVYGEGQEATKHYFPPECAEQVFVNFPDPWPKKRHAKHRLINPSFIAEIARLLKPGALLTLVTDDPHYSQVMIKALQAQPLLTSCYENPFYTSELPGYGSSFFEDFWRQQGKLIRYHQYLRKDGL